MKVAEWKKLNNINNETEMMAFFRNNLLTGKFPVALYSCIVCDEIIFDPKMGCSVCKGERND